MYITLEVRRYAQAKVKGMLNISEKSKLNEALHNG